MTEGQSYILYFKDPKHNHYWLMMITYRRTTQDRCCNIYTGTDTDISWIHTDTWVMAFPFSIGVGCKGLEMNRSCKWETWVHSGTCQHVQGWWCVLPFHSVTRLPHIWSLWQQRSLSGYTQMLPQDTDTPSRFHAHVWPLLRDKTEIRGGIH